MQTNQVILSGYVGNAPEARVTARSQTATTRIALGQNEIFWKDNERQERTHWHYIVCYGRLAEVVLEHVEKGAGLVVTGRLSTRPWHDKELTRELMVTEIIASSIEITRWPKNKQLPADPSMHEATPVSELEHPIPF